ncbi:S41 family peptidase [candidate division KSB1 bacterium]|nr:S41 family peptidase [candidate division KSB1 bacterium]
MNMQKKKWLRFIPVAFVLMLLLVGMNAVGGNDIYAVIQNYLPDMSNIFKEVSRRYVDEVDPEMLFKAGIDGMLGTLDPYTSYIEKEDKKQLEIMTEGKYQGVGLPINMRNKVVTVADPPFLGTPSARAGIREGDQIIKVDGTVTKGLGLDGTVQLIRGPAGSEVTLTIRREGVEDLIDFKLIRAKIKVADIRYVGVIDDGIGYIQLIRFSKNAGRETAAAIEDLLQKGADKGLILDLRYNPGGLLEAAVEISDLFLPKKAMIVSTRGRTKNSIQEFHSFSHPIYSDGPIVVLVNGASASASEIVAGAIQDHDRGIILGDTTFGKGLVQTVVPLSKTSALKVTTAKYYTPSGRCIQKRNYSTWQDSALQTDNGEYKTKNGRTVRGGGGIIPDIVLEPPLISELTYDMGRKSLYFNFAVHYANTHDKLNGNFEITDGILEEFKEYVKSKEYEYTHPIEKDLRALEKEAKSKGYSEIFIQKIDALEAALEDSKVEMFDQSVKDIKRVLRQELATKFLGTRHAVEIGLKEDLVVQEAITIIHDQNHYKNVLIAENE